MITNFSPKQSIFSDKPHWSPHDFYGGKLSQAHKEYFKQTLKIAANVKPSDLPPICYENLISLDTITTAIISPSSENGKRFWTAVQMKKRGFTKQNIAGY